MEDAEWFAEHSAYLATPEWAFKRGQVLARDNYRCQARMQQCRGEATQAHHLNYRHWRDEPLFELVSVCASCHERLTQIDREERPKLRTQSPRDPFIWERAALDVGMDIPV